MVGLSWVLAILVGIFSIHQWLYWLYYWQIKEYRWDRFVDGFDMGQQFNLRRWYRPTKTIRIVVAALLSIAFLLLVANFYYWWLILFTPVVVGGIVVLTAPIFNWQKAIIIRKATKKMAGFEGTVVGVTGSYGKSMTKELLKTVLAEKYRVLATEGNNNTEIGVALTVLHKLNKKHQVFVVEMGAYKRGEIKAICDMVHPQVGIITGIGDQHLSLFGSLENIKKAKYELVDSLPAGGYGIVAEKDFSESEAESVTEGIEDVRFKYQGNELVVKLRGKRLLRNVVGVIKVARHLGLTRQQIKSGLSKYSPSYPQLIRLSQDRWAVDDSYNASVESFLSILEYLKVYRGYTQIVVTPGIIELGSRAKEDHQLIGKKLKNIDQVWLTNKRYYKELNRWGNVKLMRGSDKIVLPPKSVVVFKGRVPKEIISCLVKSGQPV